MADRMQVLRTELMQLGLPKEHADELLSHYSKQSLALRQQFAESSFRLTQLNAVDWRVSVVLGHSGTDVVEAPVVSVRLDVTRPEEAGATKPILFEASEEKFAMLLSELKAARAMMGELEGE